MNKEMLAPLHEKRELDGLCDFWKTVHDSLQRKTDRLHWEQAHHLRVKQHLQVLNLHSVSINVFEDAEYLIF